MTVKQAAKHFYGMGSKERATRYAKDIRSRGYPARVSKTRTGYAVVM